MSDKTGGPAFPSEENREHMGAIYRAKHQGMTLRQYAAIKLRVPNSGTDWLDEMIEKSLRDEVAGKAMQGLMGRVWGNQPAEELFPIWAKSAYAVADAMLKARQA